MGIYHCVFGCVVNVLLLEPPQAISYCGAASSLAVYGGGGARGDGGRTTAAAGLLGSVFRRAEVCNGSEGGACLFPRPLLTQEETHKATARRITRAATTIPISAPTDRFNPSSPDLEEY